MSAVDEIAAELAEIKRTLDTVGDREKHLYSRRIDVWRRGRELGMTPAELAEYSGVTDVTVRQLLQRSSR